LQISATYRTDKIIASVIPECTWRNDVSQTEMHTAELLVPKPTSCKVEIATE